MQTRHYIDKPRYWVYDPYTKKISHQHSYPYHNMKQWLYAGSPGHVVVEDDQILDFYPIDDSNSKEQNKPYCYHMPKEYVGFTDKFMYCSKCGEKL